MRRPYYFGGRSCIIEPCPFYTFGFGGLRDFGAFTLGGDKGAFTLEGDNTGGDFLCSDPFLLGEVAGEFNMVEPLLFRDLTGEL